MTASAHERRRVARSRLEEMVRDPACAVDRIIATADELLATGLVPLASEMLASLRPWHEQMHVMRCPVDSIAELELTGTLLQEMVLRKMVVPGNPEAEAVRIRLSRAKHPLAWLPLGLSPLERPAPLPHYGQRATSYDRTDPFADGITVQSPGGPLPWPARDVTDPAEGARMARAVENWTRESNGVVEAKVFALAEPCDAAALPHVLTGLPLACRSEVWRMWRIGADAAHRMLFETTSFGGAYTSGLHGAYGRLSAWASVAAMAGCRADCSFDAAEAETERCSWLAFDTDSDWFYHVAWDVGLALLRPDRRTIAVMAATDTD